MGRGFGKKIFGAALQSGQDGLRLGNALLASIEARTELLYGFRVPQGDVVSRLSYDRVDCLP